MLVFYGVGVGLEDGVFLDVGEVFDVELGL